MTKIGKLSSIVQYVIENHLLIRTQIIILINCIIFFDLISKVLQLNFMKLLTAEKQLSDTSMHTSICIYLVFNRGFESFTAFSTFSRAYTYKPKYLFADSKLSNKL